MRDEPEYLSSSPTVMSYDYATGDYFAPAYRGQQLPAQAAAAAVRAAEPVISSMPATAPLVAHPVPNYPKQGHVPTFTMPMNKGEWNIRGIDIPTYSPAINPMPGSDWRTFPQPIDGAQLTWARPQFSAFAGLGYGAADPGSWGRSREVRGQGGWRYKQFNDGSVQILISPDPTNLAPGAVLRGDINDANYLRWVAITNEIGAWKDYAQARTSSVFKATVDVATGTVKGLRKRKKRKGGKAAAAAPVAAGMPAEALDETEPSFFSKYGTQLAVAGALVALGVVVVVASTSGSRSGKAK